MWLVCTVVIDYRIIHNKRAGYGRWDVNVHCVPYCNQLQIDPPLLQLPSPGVVFIWNTRCIIVIGLFTALAAEGQHWDRGRTESSMRQSKQVNVFTGNTT